MLLVQYTYPFDPNGTATTNKVVGERHTITPVNGPDFRILIPRAAPYFKSSLQLLHVASNTPLLEGIHWAAGHKFDRASNTAPFLAIYGSILILDNTIEGVVELTQYQTLGGEFTINETLALQVLANAQLDPRLAKWDNVLNVPTTYDPLLHRHHASESTGYEDMVGTLNRLADAIIASLGQSSVDQVARSHISNTNNPHNTMLAQLPDAQHLLGINAPNAQYLIQQANAGGLLRRIDIAADAAEEAELRNRPNESFSEVFNTWERIAWQNNNPQEIPAELESWSFDEANNQLVSTTNSVSMVGFISPTTVSGDYEFEIEMESTDNDDDVIGVFLGKAFIDGKWRNLVAQRTAAVNGAGVYLTYDRYGDRAVNLVGSNVDLLEYPNGWNGYRQRGIVKLLVRRVGSVITVMTTNPGTDYVGTAILTYDLNTRPELAPFKGPVHLGYIAASQRNARFKTLRRTGSKLPIVNLATRKIYEFDGIGYIEVTNKTFSEYLQKALFYYCKYFGRLYYADQPGAMTLISTTSGSENNSGSGVTPPIQPVTNQLNAGDFFVPDNAAGPATYLVPLAPANFATIQWIEGEVSFATNKLILQNTDKPIMGLSEPLEVTSAGAGGKLVYFESLGYWKVYLNSQAGSSASIQAPSSVIQRPTLTSPTQDQSGVQANFGLTSTSFTTTPALADSLSRYDWQLATDSSFNNLLWSGSTSIASASPSAVIPNGTRVYARMRSVGVNYGVSEWSPVVSFVVAAVAGPTTVTIAGTQLASGGVTHQFTVQSSVWSGSGTHVASQVQVLTTGGTVAYDSGEIAGAVVSHKPFDSGFRPTNLTDYVAKVRYKLSTGQWTDYTSSALRTGNGAFTSVSTTFQTSYYSQRTINALTSWYTVGGSNDPYGEPAPYHICFADTGTGQSAQWVCDPSDPLGNPPGDYHPDMGQPLVSEPYPRTVVTTQRVTNDQVSYNTSVNTQKWTES